MSLCSLRRCAMKAAITLLALLVSIATPRSASAQCEPEWQAFDPSTASFPGVLTRVNGSVRAVTTWDPDGSGPRSSLVVVGGEFSVAGNVIVSNIATYDELTGMWSSLGTGPGAQFGGVIDLDVMPNGDLVAVGTGNGISRWDGSSWEVVATGSDFGGFLSALAVLAGGELVVGGRFETAGGVPAKNIARWNGTSWSAMGTGIEETELGLADVRVLTPLPNGDLLAAGRFNIAGGVIADNIALWDGIGWRDLAGGIPVDILSPGLRSVAVLPNGDVVAAGDFISVGGMSAYYFARFDGSTWSALGTGLEASLFTRVWTLTALPNGDLVAGGSFVTGDGWIANRVARWNGTAWSEIGSGFRSGQTFAVRTLTVLPDGGLMAAGNFETVGGVDAINIARWDGNTWSALGTGMNRTLSALAVLPNGDVVAGGSFSTVGGVPANSIARWNDSNWSALGTGMNDSVFDLEALPNGDVVAGGSFSTAGGVPVNSIARWDGNTWSALGTGMNGSVWDLALLPNGDLVAAGDFNTAGGVTVNQIARWDGSTWSALGNAAQHTNGVVSSIAVLPNGDLVAGGFFSTSGGIPTHQIARWDGSTWSVVGTAAGIDELFVFALGVLPNGDLVVGGVFESVGGVPANNIARWDGSTWSALGDGITGPLGSHVVEFTVLPNGDLVAAGSFSAAGGVTANNIARWDGSTWSALGAGVGGPSPTGVSTIRLLPNGDLVAGGPFITAGGVVAPFIARLVCIAPACDPVDFNNNGVFPEDDDVINFLNVLAGATCPTCNDIDFNNNGVFPEDRDVVDFFSVLAGSVCP
ncbi:MAG: WD40 repeat domain-containing protein [Phycisphaerae bacterium]|jgi:hypothetical protein